MSAALATAPTQTPDATTAPTRLSRVLGLVRSLIDFGRDLTESLRRHVPGLDPGDAVTGFDFRYRAGLFGTSDVPTILLRIARGLRRAAALQALLLARAQRGRDLEVAPVRVYAPRPPSTEPKQPRTERAPLPLEPSDEEIASDVRRRPVGAVIVEICLDLGVQPGDLGRDMRQELTDAVIYYGGNLFRLLRVDDAARLEHEYIAILRSDAPLPPEFQPFPVPFAEMAEFAACPGLRAGATGPP